MGEQPSVYNCTWSATTRETEILSNILNNFLQEVAVAEIVIKGCSRVLGLLTTKNLIVNVTMEAVN